MMMMMMSITDFTEEEEEVTNSASRQRFRDLFAQFEEKRTKSMCVWVCSKKEC